MVQSGLRTHSFRTQCVPSTGYRVSLVAGSAGGELRYEQVRALRRCERPTGGSRLQRFLFTKFRPFLIVGVVVDVDFDVVVGDAVIDVVVGDAVIIGVVGVIDVVIIVIVVAVVEVSVVVIVVVIP